MMLVAACVTAPFMALMRCTEASDVPAGCAECWRLLPASAHQGAAVCAACHLDADKGVCFEAVIALPKAVAQPMQLCWSLLLVSVCLVQVPELHSAFKDADAVSALKAWLLEVALPASLSHFVGQTRR